MWAERGGEGGGALRITQLPGARALTPASSRRSSPGPATSAAAPGPAEHGARHHARRHHRGHGGRDPVRVQVCNTKQNTPVTIKAIQPQSTWTVNELLQQSRVPPCHITFHYKGGNGIFFQALHTIIFFAGSPCNSEPPHLECSIGGGGQ